MTCQHCKHWFIDPAQTVIEERGICTLASTVDTPKKSDELTVANEDSQSHATAKVYSAFGFKFVTAQLETSASFECSQFEAK